jgi:hypothetical protein
MTTPTNPTDQSNLAFLPWVRTGAAAAIDVPDTLAAQLGVANITASLTVNEKISVPPLTVRLRGPADIIGIDAHQIIRTDPAPGSSDFEASNFACVEFDRPDYPWLFTPAAAFKKSAAELGGRFCYLQRSPQRSPGGSSAGTVALSAQLFRRYKSRPVEI